MLQRNIKQGPVCLLVLCTSMCCLELYKLIIAFKIVIQMLNCGSQNESESELICYAKAVRKFINLHMCNA